MRNPSKIRPARPEEAEALSALARRSKSAWGYPPEWIELWGPELRIAVETILSRRVELAEEAGKIVGVFVLAEDAPDAELEALWVAPERMRRGIGGRLLRRAMACARGNGAENLFVDSDPHAVDFYRSHGAVQVGEVPSSPAGRTLPRLRLSLDS